MISIRKQKIDDEDIHYINYEWTYTGYLTWFNIPYYQYTLELR